MFSALQCGTEDALRFEDKQSELTLLKSEMETLADISICGDELEYKYVAFGSKPCGAPQSYLVCSTSIDTSK
tara:strand:- start:1960 stop:2175 length:216 start_codon:yes stop_codon:yes gene_type:complete